MIQKRKLSEVDDRKNKYGLNAIFKQSEQVATKKV